MSMRTIPLLVMVNSQGNLQSFVHEPSRSGGAVDERHAGARVCATGAAR
jgi:hypothetical protein